MTLDDARGRVTLTVDETSSLLGLGINETYAAVHRNEIPHLKVGRRLLVKAPELLRMFGVEENDEPAGGRGDAT